jgi:hypothetical protein
VSGPRNDNPVRRQAALWASIVAGTIAVLLTDLLTSVIQLENSLGSWGIAATLFFLAAVLIGRIHGFASTASVAFVGAGIAIGTFVDAIVVEMILGGSRNLWPLGIVLWWFVGAVPVIVGLLLGNRWRTHSRASDGEWLQT